MIIRSSLGRSFRSFFLVLAVFFQCSAFADAEAPLEFPVRVLLGMCEESAPVVWKLFCEQGFRVEDIKDPSAYEDFDEKNIEISFSKGRLAVNGNRLASNQLKVIAQDGNMFYNEREYAGDMLVMCHEKSIYFINSVDLEEYLFSVLRWEGWPGWPLEVNRVFAIMCRTYVVNKVLRERKKQSIFDIKNDNRHQTYKGVHGADHLREALKDTQGVVMTHEGHPIEAMYDACCGGVVPGLMSGVNFKGSPYLKREYGCPYCKKTKLYTWQKEYSIGDFHALLACEIGAKATVIDVSVSKKDKAGIVQEVTVKTKAKNYKFSGKKMYNLLRDLRSFCFDVTKTGKKIIFKGRGYGHHLGVCQWGVRQMVKENWHYLDILEFYYPGVSFMNIQIIAAGE